MDYYINWGLCNLPTFKLPDRCSGRGGRVCALIDKSIPVAKVVLCGDYSELELVVFDVLNVLLTIRMFVAYRPQNYGQNASHYVNKCKKLNSLKQCLTATRPT